MPSDTPINEVNLYSSQFREVVTNLQILLHHPAQLAHLQHAALPPHRLAVAEEHEGRDCLDTVLRREALVLLNVYLEDAKLVAELLLQFFQYRVHPLAGNAPCGIEVNQYQLTAIDDRVKILFHTV